MTRRVALLAPEYPGCGPHHGIGEYLRALAGALAASAEVRVLVVSPTGRFAGDAAAVSRVGDAPRHPLRALACARWLRGELDAFAADVVEYPNWGGLGAALGAIRPRVARLSTPAALERPRSPRALAAWPAHRALERRAVRSADLVIADSAAMAHVAAAVYRRRCDAIIPHAWSGRVAEEPPAGGDVLFVGRLEPRKGIDALAAAWAALGDARGDAVLHVVGADPSGFGRAAFARWRAQGATLHGRLDDAALARLRSRCAIQAIPSRFESFGLVALEAFAAGQAVIATDGGALPEVVGDAGVVVPRSDARALAAALRDLLARPALSGELAARGRDRLRAFSPRAWIRETLAAYDRAAAAHAARCRGSDVAG